MSGHCHSISNILRRSEILARTSKPAEFDAIVVGAGVGGLYAIHRLRNLGLKVRGFEAAGGVGGTWYWNRYPGCRCDVESMEYSYSFSNDLQQQWHWPERYGTQPEILRYINHVADRFDLRRDIEFNTRVKTAVFDSKTNTWTVTTDKGSAATARFCIMATGNLSTPRTPNYPGLESFGGEWYHTGLWPHDGVDFTGLRVGVIGTGSSGVQSIPIIAKQAKHLYVFQRTANFSLPARNAPMDPHKESTHKAHYPERRRAAFDTPFGIAGYPPPVKSALDASEEERLRAYEAKWAEGGSISFLPPGTGPATGSTRRARNGARSPIPRRSRALRPRPPLRGSRGRSRASAAGCPAACEFPC
jgi:cyclohexanone monooxygenase